MPQEGLVLPRWYHQQARREMGIAENLIRVSVGLEDIEDLIADFERALT